MASDDDTDIYGDLPNFNLEETIQKLENENKILSQQVSELTLKVEQLEAANKELTKLNKNLSANISVLFKTAKVELERKDNTIQKLTKERDDIFFRRFKFTRPKDHQQSEDTNRGASDFNRHGHALRERDRTSRNSNSKGYQDDQQTALKSMENASDLKERDRREEEPSALQSRERRPTLIESSRHGAESSDLESREGLSSKKEKSHREEDTSTSESRTKTSANLREKSHCETEASSLELGEGPSNVKGKDSREEEPSTTESRSRRSSTSKEKSRGESKATSMELKGGSSSQKGKSQEEESSTSESRSGRSSTSKEKSHGESKATSMELKGGSSSLKGKKSQEEESSTSESRSGRSSTSKEKSHGESKATSMELKGGSSSLKGKKSQEEESLTSEAKSTRPSNNREKGHREPASSSVKLREESSHLQGKSRQEEESSTAESRSRRSSNLRGKCYCDTETPTAELKKGSSDPKGKNREEDKCLTSNPRTREKTSKEKETSIADSKEETSSTSKEKIRQSGKRPTSESRKERSSDSKTKGHREEKTSTSEVKKQEPLISEEKSNREVDSSASDLSKESSQKEKNRPEKELFTSETSSEKSSDSKNKNCHEEEPLSSESVEKKSSDLKETSHKEESSSMKEEKSSNVKEKIRCSEEALASKLRKEKSSDLKKESHKEETLTSESTEKKLSDSKTKSCRRGRSISKSKKEESSISNEGSRKEEEPSTSGLQKKRIQVSKEKTHGKQESPTTATRRSSRQAARSSKESERNVEGAFDSKSLPKQRLGKISQKENEQTSSTKMSRTKTPAPEPEFAKPPAGRSKTSAPTPDNSENLAEIMNKNVSRLILRYKRSENSVKEVEVDTPSLLETQSGEDKNDKSKVDPRATGQTTTNDDLAHLVREANRVETPTLSNSQPVENIPFSQMLEEIRGEEALMEPPEKPQSVQAQSENPTPETSRDTAFTEDSQNTFRSPRKKRRGRGNSRLYVKTRSSSRLSAKVENVPKQTTTEVPANVSLLQVLQLEEIRRTSTSPKTPNKLVLSTNMELPSSPLPTLVSDVQRVLEFPSFPSLAGSITDLTAENLHQRLIASALGESAPIVADFTHFSSTRQSSSQQSANLPDSTARSSSPTNREKISDEDIPMSSADDNFIVRSQRSANEKESTGQLFGEGSVAKGGLSAILSPDKSPPEEIRSVSTGSLFSPHRLALTNTKELSSDGVSKITATYSTPLLPSTPTKNLKNSCEDVSSIFDALEDASVTYSRSTSPMKETRRSETSESSVALSKSSSASSGNDKAPDVVANRGDSASTRKEVQHSDVSKSPDHSSPTASAGNTVIRQVAPEDFSSLLAVLGSPSITTREEIQRSEVSRSPAHSNPTTVTEKVMSEDISSLLAVLGSPSVATREGVQRSEVFKSPAHSNPTAPDGTTAIEQVMPDGISGLLTVVDSPSIEVCSKEIPASSGEVNDYSTKISALDKENDTRERTPVFSTVCDSTTELVSSDGKKTSPEKISSDATSDSPRVSPREISDKTELERGVSNTAVTSDGSTMASSATVNDNNFSRQDASSLLEKDSSVILSSAPKIRNETPCVPSLVSSHPDVLPPVSRDNEEVSTEDIRKLPAREDPPSTTHKKIEEVSRRRARSFSGLANVTEELPATESISDKPHEIPNDVSDQDALKCITSQNNYSNAESIPQKKQTTNLCDKPCNNSQALQWNFTVRRRTKVEVKMIVKSPPSVPVPPVSTTVNRPVNEVHHRQRSRSRSPQRSHMRENHPPERLDHGHRRRHHPRDRRSPPRHRSRSPPYDRSPPPQRPSRRDDRRHGFDFSRRSRSCSPFVRQHHRRDHRAEQRQRRPDKLPTDKKERELLLFGRSPAQSSPIHKPARDTPVHKPARDTQIRTPIRDSAIHKPARDTQIHTFARNSANHTPAQQPRAPEVSQRPIIMTVSRKRKNVKLENSLEDDKSVTPVSAKPASLSSSSRLVQTPLDFRERYAEVFSNTGESSDSETDGVTFSDSESDKSKDSDVSYRPKGRKRKTARVSKPEMKRPRIQADR